MRVGKNPEKDRLRLLSHKNHRIIIPFWIPNLEDPYFKLQAEVLRLCLQSLVDSINMENVNITLINNASCDEASAVAESFVRRGLIDKYVVRFENRGKLEAIINEAAGTFEDYITISDADFFFFNGWEESVFSIFSNIPRAGMVSPYPCPNLAFHYNSRWLLSSSWKKGKVVDITELNLVEKGLGNAPEKGIFSGKGVRKEVPWFEQQYYLKGPSTTAVLGAVHALATFKRDVFLALPKPKVQYIFKDGYEHEYLDFFPERLGYYRLSTTHCLAYHMGNTIPDEDVIGRNNSKQSITTKYPQFTTIRRRKAGKCSYWVSSMVVRLGRKMKWL